jgi:hypothetical protein
VNGKWVWVKYDYLKEKHATDNTLRPDLQKRLEARFGGFHQPQTGQREVIQFDEEIQRREDEVERELDSLMLNNDEEVTEEDLFGVAEDDPEEQGSGKRLRFS